MSEFKGTFFLNSKTSLFKHSCCSYSYHLLSGTDLDVKVFIFILQVYLSPPQLTSSIGGRRRYASTLKPREQLSQFNIEVRSLVSDFLILQIDNEYYFPLRSHMVSTCRSCIWLPVEAYSILVDNNFTELIISTNANTDEHDYIRLQRPMIVKRHQEDMQNCSVHNDQLQENVMRFTKAAHYQKVALKY